MSASQRFNGLTGYSSRLDVATGELFDTFVSTLPELSSTAHWVLDQVRVYSMLPSKRIRGSLAAAAYDQTAATHLDARAIQLGVAIEAIQNHLLIIDDVIDQSTTRRGGPTIHERYRNYAQRDERTVDMVGILGGMLPGQFANYALSTLDVDSTRLRSVMAMTARDLATTDMAQIDDIEQMLGTDVTTEELLRKHAQKSSYYSFINPLSCGLVLAGCDERLARADATAFGLPAGIAFQLRDDYLGVFGDASETGKPVLDDLREGKYTLMVHLAATTGTDDDRRQLGILLGNPEAGEAELMVLREILQRSGAAEQSMTMARQYADDAIVAARAATAWTDEFGDMLAGLVEFSIERSA